MIVVDSSIWIDFFNSPQTKYSALEVITRAGADIAITYVILTEVLAGFKKERDFENAKNIFERLNILSVDRNTHIDTATLYRKLRVKGITIRGILDCLIAQTCIEHNAELLTTDQDFKKIASHSTLKLLSLPTL
ncbi:MAG: PIN domain nuclease [Deltaproteobacteria bacterium]|nr:PIN domain nuclease [Deltaproteobacteria bacterium]